jgi:hypothetical protein
MAVVADGTDWVRLLVCLLKNVAKMVPMKLSSFARDATEW